MIGVTFGPPQQIFIPACCTREALAHAPIQQRYPELKAVIKVFQYLSNSLSPELKVLSRYFNISLSLELKAVIKVFQYLSVSGAKGCYQGISISVCLRS